MWPQVQGISQWASLGALVCLLEPASCHAGRTGTVGIALPSLLRTRVSEKLVLHVILLHGKWKLLVTQLCLTPCDPMDYSPPGSSVHGILQARILEWVALPSWGDLPDSGIESWSPALQADSLSPEPPGKLNSLNTRCQTYNNEQKVNLLSFFHRIPGLVILVIQ